MIILIHHQCESVLRISRAQLKKFVLEVSSYDRKLDFHNFQRAVTILHTTHLMINLLGLQEHTCSGLEAAAVLLAALCHDLDHDGLSNSFHVRSKSALAARYSYRSVLEQHHSAMAKKLLKDTGCLDSLNEKELEKVTGLMKRCILATDMSQHKQQLNTLVSRIDHILSSGKSPLASRLKRRGLEDA